MTFAIRQADPRDHAALLALFRAFYDEEGFDYEPERMAETLKGVLSRRDTAAFIAEDGAKAIGGATVSTAYGLEAGLYSEMEDIYVLPEWRGKGVGDALFTAASEWARSLGCRDMEVVLTPRGQADAGLVAWYTARGFEDTRRCIFERRL